MPMIQVRMLGKVLTPAQIREINTMLRNAGGPSKAKNRAWPPRSFPKRFAGARGASARALTAEDVCVLEGVKK